MKKILKLTSNRINLAAIAAMAASAASAQAQDATATISAVQSGNVYDYTITLHNTGTYQLDSFWYGWTQSGNNLGADPTSAGNSLGWSDVLDGTSIKFEGSDYYDQLNPGQSATFTFVSTENPTAITTPPQGESVAYVNGIDFSQGVAYDSTPVFSPTYSPVPESTSPALLAVGCLGVVFLMQRKAVKPVSSTGGANEA